MTEYDQYVTHFPRGSETGTDHLVEAQLDSNNVKTACGLELFVTGSRIGSGRQTYLSELTEGTQIGDGRCGNCPWEDTDY